MSQTARSSRGEIPALTGLRLVAAFVWSCTTSGSLAGPTSGCRGRDHSARCCASGWLGVDLFFVLSGFVLTRNYVDRPRHGGPRRAAIAGFYRARLARIWPTWMVVLTAVTAGQVVEQSAAGRGPPTAGSTRRPCCGRSCWSRSGTAPTTRPPARWDPGGRSARSGWPTWPSPLVVLVLLYRLRRCPPVALGALALVAVLPFAHRCLALGRHDWAWSWLLRLAGAFLAGRAGRPLRGPGRRAAPRWPERRRGWPRRRSRWCR